MKLPPEKLIDLYEQVVKEMVECRETDTARALLRSTLPLAMLREEDGDRYSTLDCSCGMHVLSILELHTHLWS